jgi:hypothetical protein
MRARDYFFAGGGVGRTPAPGLGADGGCGARNGGADGRGGGPDRCDGGIGRGGGLPFTMVALPW